MRTTMTLDDDLAIRLEQYRLRLGVTFKQVLNEAVRAGLEHMERQPDITRESRRTKPLRLGRRLAGSIENVSDALAVAEGENFR